MPEILFACLIGGTFLLLDGILFFRVTKDREYPANHPFRK